jgi:two-component system chemotaxis response regulator CheB
MPHMDGMTFLRQLMAERPTRVLVCSTLTEQGAPVALEALAAGAVGYVSKPRLGVRDALTGSARELIRSVKQAAQATPRAPHPAPHLSASLAPTLAPMLAPSPPPQLPSHQAAPGRAASAAVPLVAIGCSTGGTQALEQILTALPANSPALVIVQHMPEKFTAAFATRLNGLCAIEVREARNGDRVRPGLALIAPGGLHMRLARSGTHPLVQVLNGPPVNCHKPSVDVLFKSVAEVLGAQATGVILTGMGDDGARGLRDMHQAGAYTLAQDEASCVVYGMPKEAVKKGAVEKSLPLSMIYREVLQQLASY